MSSAFLPCLFLDSHKKFYFLKSPAVTFTLWGWNDITFLILTETWARERPSDLSVWAALMLNTKLWDHRHLAWPPWSAGGGICGFIREIVPEMFSIILVCGEENGWGQIPTQTGPGRQVAGSPWHGCLGLMEVRQEGSSASLSMDKALGHAQKFNRRNPCGACGTVWRTQAENPETCIPPDHWKCPLLGPS